MHPDRGNARVPAPAVTDPSTKGGMSPISLGIVSDEISQDFREALEYGKEWGLKIYELRCVKTGRVPNIDRTEFKEILTLVADHAVEVSALSPGIFKHPLSKKDKLEKELSETLTHTLAMAKQLGARIVIVFGFQREQDEPERHYHDAVNLMKRAASMAEREGMRLAIENEPGFWCDSGANTAALIRDVGSKALGANWDPCNGYGTDERPYPDGYGAIKDFVLNVHVKDTQEGALIKCVPVGEGIIDWKGQLRSLVADRRVRHVTIETHCLPLIEKSKQNVETLRAYLQELTPTAKAMS